MIGADGCRSALIRDDLPAYEKHEKKTVIDETVRGTEGSNGELNPLGEAEEIEADDVYEPFVEEDESASRTVGQNPETDSSQPW